ncbi:MAG TPA: hypothetical protein VHO24_19965 [Opitutaceae bacterium]|nr:hypothetical protein [Opitutaceae bacterium]
MPPSRFALLAGLAILVGIAAALVVYVALLAALVFLITATAIALLLRIRKARRSRTPSSRR